VPRIREVRHVAELAESLAEAPPELVDPLYAELQELRDQELAGGEHVKLLLVNGRAVRVNLFVDVDGTLWLERFALGPEREPE